jgi:hypothetical protein
VSFDWSSSGGSCAWLTSELKLGDHVRVRPWDGCSAPDFNSLIFDIFI